MTEGLKVVDKRSGGEFIQDAHGTSPAEMMMAAMNKGMELEKLEKFMALQERWEANEAKKAYHEAMAAFKGNPPQIEKDRKVSYKASSGITAYAHASLANVTNKINSALSQHGLSASWETFQNGDEIKVTCTVTHKQGHSESTSLVAAPDTSGSKNHIQSIGSTISYLERYTILALTGLATSDMDDDGQAAATQHITEEQVKAIQKEIKSCGADEKKFLAYFKTSSLTELPSKDYQKAMSLLKAKRKAAQNDS